MKVMRVHDAGGPAVLSYEDADVPMPAEGEALVRIEAAGLNFIDTYQRSGQYPLDFPAVLGSEAAGVVESVGDRVTDVSEGDRVAFALGSGAYAEYAVMPAAKLVPIPADVDSRTAAAVMLQGMTAHYLATSTFPLRPGMRALVTAASGGVGHLLVQIAKRRSAHVIGTVSTEEKGELARQAGVDDVIYYRELDLADEVARLTGGEGVHVVYDSVGADTFAASLASLRPRGYLVLYGQASGKVADLDPQVLNKKGSLYLTRPSLGHYVADRDELLGRANDVFSWIAAGELRVRIDRTWPLRDAAEAHRYMESGQTKGKVLLIP